MHEQLSFFLNDAGSRGFQDVPHDPYATVEKDHGRIEQQEYRITPDIDWFEERPDRPVLESFGMVVSHRTVDYKPMLQKDCSCDCPEHAPFPLPKQRKNRYDIGMQTRNSIPSITGTRILIHGHSFLGDALMTTPFLRELRKLKPASITVIARDAGQEVYRRQDSVDSVISGRTVQRGFYHTALVLKDTFQEALRAKRLKIPDRISFKGEGTSMLLTRAVRRPHSHGIRRYFELLDLIPPEILEYSFPLSRVDRKEAHDLTGKRQLVSLAPCSTDRAKRWPAEFYITLCRRLKKSFPKYTIALLGTEEESPICGEIAERAGLLDLSGRTTLGGLAAVLEKSRLFISGDTGPMHLASMFPATALLSLFGATDPALCGPPNPAAQIIHKPEGMSAISPGEVIEKAVTLLKRK